MTSLAKSTVVAAIKMAFSGWCLGFIHSHLGVGKGRNVKFARVFGCIIRAVARVWVRNTCGCMGASI